MASQPTPENMFNWKDLWKKFTGKEDIKSKVSPPFPETEVEEVCQQIFGEEVLQQKPPIIDSEVLMDLEMFEGLGLEKEYSILNEIDHTHTKCGRFLLQKILANPTDKVEILRKRQDIIRRIINQPELYREIVIKLRNIGGVESELLWFWRKLNEETSYLFNMVFFQNKYLKFLNTQELAMRLYNYYIIIFSPLYGMISPILMVLVPFFMIKFYFKTPVTLKLYLHLLKTAFTGLSNVYKINIEEVKNSNLSLSWTSIISMLVWLVFYIHGLLTNINNSKNTNQITNIMHGKINSIARLVKEGHSLFDVLGKDLSESSFFVPTKLEKHFKILWNPIFETTPSFKTNKGLVLKTYKSIQEKKENLIEMIRYYSNIDCFQSIVTMVSQEERIDYCFAEYLTKTPLPSIEMTDVAYPILKNNIVTNDMTLGLSNPRNAIITGPNAGGKSTFLKTVCLAVVFAQTLGVVPASSFELTPFSLISTYLNIPDSKGKESLFEAEVRRSLDYIKKIKKLEGKFCFLIMDEIFSSTNPQEGISGAYAIANAIAKNSNNITILTTHYSYLSKLEKTGKFKNYKVPITRDSDNNIKYLYKLEPGVSDQFIALELLNDKGFDKNIVEEAEYVCSQIQKNNKQADIKSMDRRKKVKRKINRSRESNKLADNSNKNKTESNKLTNEINKLADDSNKNNTESNKLTNEINKLADDSNKNNKETNKLAEDSNKLANDSNKLAEDSNKNNKETNKLANDSNKLADDSNKLAEDSNKNNKETNKLAEDSNKLAENSNKNEVDSGISPEVSVDSN